MKNKTKLKSIFIVLLLFTFSGIGFGQAVGEPEVVNPSNTPDFKPKLSIGGNFDTDKFLVEYRLPEDTKIHVFKILNPDGKVIVKEKRGKEKAGYYNFWYNIKYEPKGIYTFRSCLKMFCLISNKNERKGQIV